MLSQQTIYNEFKEEMPVTLKFIYNKFGHTSRWFKTAIAARAGIFPSDSNEKQAASFKWVMLEGIAGERHMQKSSHKYSEQCKLFT